MTQFDDLLSGTKDLVTVRRVYGEPIVSNGVTLIPAAAVRGGMGGGEGDNPQGGGTGRGGGMGITARPVGAYRIKGDEVAWMPAVDTSKVIFTGQIVVIVALLVARSILKRRRR